MPYVGMGALLPGWAGRKKFRPSLLFAGGAPGAWFDPSDLFSMYQDSAGTTPAAVGSPVGLRLDKRLGLARGAAIALQAVSLINGAGTAVNNGNGTYTATNGGTLRLNFPLASLVNGTYYEVLVPASAISLTGTGNVTDWCDQPSGSVPLASPGVRYIAMRATYDATMRFVDLTAGAVGSVTLLDPSAVVLQPLPGNHASQSTSTSRSILQQDAGGRYYLLRDGVDDGEATGNIDFTGTDKMTVFAGLYKASDAAAGVIVELGANSDTVNGTFGLVASAASVGGSPATRQNYSSRLHGDTAANYTDGWTYAAPHSAVLTQSLDIAGATQPAENVLRVNGSVGTTFTNGQLAGIGNLSNAPINIGRRSGGTVPFNGRDYGLIVLGRTATASEITRTERWLAARAGVAL